MKDLYTLLTARHPAEEEPASPDAFVINLDQWSRLRWHDELDEFVEYIADKDGVEYFEVEDAEEGMLDLASDPFEETEPEDPDPLTFEESVDGRRAEAEQIAARIRRRHAERSSSKLELSALGLNSEAIDREIERLQSRANRLLVESNGLRREAARVSPSALRLKLGKPLPAVPDACESAKREWEGFPPCTDETSEAWWDHFHRAVDVLERAALIRENPEHECRKRSDQLAAPGFHELNKLANALRPGSDVSLDEMYEPDFTQLMHGLRTRGGFESLIERTENLRKGTAKPEPEESVGGFMSLDIDLDEDLSIENLYRDPRAQLLAEVEALLASLKDLRNSFYKFREDPYAAIERAEDWAYRRLEMRQLKSRPVIERRRRAA
jgi:hypothetical protein